MKHKPHTLREKDAILYLSIGRTKFRTLIANGRLPQPYCLDGCRLWKTSELERAFDNLIGAAANDNEPNVENSWADVIETTGGPTDD
jgi:predicted DNA-binding transcriptional regulator AlpA